ncbi:MATE family efflux transporter [Bradyrhizobium sp. 170]|uniref:MATE family efflux transporter n=1 Tax=Bradyrhizobium sp. 170 TaxID=2782641 RepID=UPI001FFE3732|nr:MATE family efflux transporter [Bradyrhizobium sp. 170]UPK02078.1 MATE family efflux transporter [Bradyrhizobium sp. 170]
MNDLTRGSISSHVLAMAVPIFAGLILVLLCGLIDLYFVAGLGEAAIAGVGTAGNAGFIINALTQIVSVGTLAAVSKAVGRGDRADANFVFNQSIGLSIICGTCTLVAGFAVAATYMRSVGADAATVEAGTTYLVWFMPALALQFVMLALSSALRGIGVVKPTMYVQVLTVAVNVILAPVLIVGWPTGHALGVQGAGLASSIAVAIGVITLWLYFQRPGNYLTLNLKEWRPQFGLSRRILAVGLPAGGEFAIMFAYMAAIYYALGNFGSAAQAGFSIGSRVLGLIQVPAMAIAFTAAPIIGQNFGAGNAARVKETVRTVLVIATAVMVAATFVAHWRPEFLLAGFTSDKATIDEGVLFLKMVSLNLVAQGIIFVCSSTFQGLGNTKPQLVSSTFRLITYVVPTLWLSTQTGFRVEHIWYLSIATTTMQALLSLWLLSRELRLRLSFSQQR